MSELDKRHVAQVIDLLCEAFSDYPLMQHVLRPDDHGYAARLHTLIHLFVTRRVLCDDRLLGVGDTEDLDAAAVLSRPAPAVDTPALRELHATTWAALGDAVRLRYDAFASACNGFDVDVPHIHLNMIGTRGRVRGKGLGRELLDQVHELSQEDPNSTGVTLTTEIEANVSLYKHFGYEVVGQSEVAPGLRTWGFFRADRGITKLP